MMTPRLMLPPFCAFRRSKPPRRIPRYENFLAGE
jgi:hypothetical protein